LADVPASYSSTSYYGGRNEGYGPRGDRGWDGSGRSDTMLGQPVAPPPTGGYDPWAGPPPASYAGPPPPSRSESRRAIRQRGLPGWLALLVLLVIAGIGGLIDMISGTTVRGGFNIALVLASIVAILVVRHRDMFPIVVAPPLVYVVASVAMLYIRSDHLHNRKILIDAAANWLVYGFPAIAGASAAVLIIAGVRMVIAK
jgi:hypothetical protein